MKIWTLKVTILLPLLIAAAGCQTASVKEAAPRGAAAILAQLEARGEERLIVLDNQIRGSAHPRCSLKEAFLKARKKRPRSKIKLVERDLVGLIDREHPQGGGDLTDGKTRMRLGELLSADTVVIGWAGENQKLIFDKKSESGEKALKDKVWYTAYLHMVAIDIPTGSLIASWSHYPAMASAVSRRISPWFRKDDVVVVQPTLDSEVLSALLAGLHRGERGRYSVVIPDLVRLLLGKDDARGDHFFSLANQDRLRDFGATLILGADNVMGLNLRAVDVRSGEIVDGLSGPLAKYVSTSHEETTESSP